MIALRHIEKVYETKEKKVKALSDVSLAFRDSEFVCILGHSGCGKTTLLNVLGGLDRYTSGDLLIDGRSTKEFKDADWDGYRSEKVGFVFQCYNLISHQTAIENVETALTIGGVGAKERRKRAIDALVKVGLADHLRKKPKQLSGGEMQRVAIARAIVNDPEIILADEPTGALDSKNSVAVMDLLRSIAKNKLVIVVTHNDELAEAYATRIIRIADGKVVSDSDPFVAPEKPSAPAPKKHSSMPYSLAAKLSLKNLAGKKVRTVLTSVAASVAVIGISLVLACSSGLNSFVDKVQRDTMSATPVTVATKATTYEPYFESLLGYVKPKKTGSSSSGKGDEPTPDVSINHTLKNATKTTITNHITQDYLDYVAKADGKRVSYDLGYNLNMHVYKSFNISFGSNGRSETVDAMVDNAKRWQALPGDKSMVYEQYDIIGKYPSAYNELALVVGKNSSITDALLTSYYLDIYSSGKEGYSYDEILNGALGSFYLLTNDEYYYKKDESKEVFSENTVGIVDDLANKIFINPNDTKKEEIRKEIDGILGEGNADKIDCYGGNAAGGKKGTELKIVGIFRLKEDAQYGMLSSSPICYTQDLTDLVKARSYGGTFGGTTYERSAVVAAQLADMAQSVLEGGGVLSTEKEKQNALADLGYSDIPTVIRFYPKTIADKDYLLDYLDAYNEGKAEEDRIEYVDNVGVAIEYIRSILGGVSAILIALTSVSLAVSAIMIGIITYVSVIERTKEIGILRSVGARKRDIARLFVTETGIIGFVAGALGLIFTSIAVLPLNSLFYSITGVKHFVGISLPQAAGLLAASVLLTIVAGLIPSLKAGKADPVKALRSE